MFLLDYNMVKLINIATRLDCHVADIMPYLGPDQMTVFIEKDDNYYSNIEFGLDPKNNGILWEIMPDKKMSFWEKVKFDRKLNCFIFYVLHNNEVCTIYIMEAETVFADQILSTRVLKEIV